MATTSVTIDCEGPCCCRCEGCKGVGYWNAYKFTLPACNSVLATGAIALNSPSSYVVPLTTPLFGSAGGTGVCGLSYATTILQANGILLSIIININIFTDGHATLYIEFSMGGGGNSYDLNVYWNCASFDCRLGGSFVYDHDTFTQVGWAFPQADYSGTTISITPDGAASWQQCGQNSDGTTYTGSFSSTAPTFMTTAPTSAKSLPTIPHPDRCSNLGARTEKRAGCNGWLCKHDCSVGLPALPGIYCQTCEFYDADPDYIDQGPSGWLK